jgi:uncharacterized protein
MITLNSLTSLTAKDLADQAKKLGVPGWRSMKKDQLIAELLKLARQKERAKAKSEKRLPNRRAQIEPIEPTKFSRKSKNRLPSLVPTATPHPEKRSAQRPARPARTSAGKDSPSRISQALRADRERTENLKNLALISTLEHEQKIPTTDRLILIVRDSYWVQVYWEITKATVERARVAFDQQWHTAKPVLRLIEIQSDGRTNTIETLVEQIPIHGGVKNWYIHLKEPGKSYRVAIGYGAADGRFFLICTSNQIRPPSSKGTVSDENWADLTNDVEKYFALSGGYEDRVQTGELQSIFEEKSRHPIHAPAFERLGSGINGHSSEFMFQVDAHMIVYGKTIPNGSVMIAGEPVRLQKDGTFSVKVDMPDRRQVLPIIASSRDGTQQRTTVLAIERNTKVMEPLTHDCDE